MFVNKIANQEYDHSLETLKVTEHLTLEKLYFQVINKAADLEKLTG